MWSNAGRAGRAAPAAVAVNLPRWGARRQTRLLARLAAAADVVIIVPVAVSIITIVVVVVVVVVVVDSAAVPARAATTRRRAPLRRRAPRPHQREPTARKVLPHSAVQPGRHAATVLAVVIVVVTHRRSAHACPLPQGAGCCRVSCDRSRVVRGGGRVRGSCCCYC